MQTVAGAGYEVDFVRWAEAQAAALREGRFDELDIENVSEEIEDLARRHRSALRCRLETLVQHLLNLQYQPEKATRSWDLTIFEQASAFWDLLDESPSLKTTIEEVTALAYARGRKLAAKETGLPVATFPETSTPEFEKALYDALDEARTP